MSKDYVELTRSFENCDVDSSAFRHLDNIGVAYEMLCNYEFLDASVRYSKCINTIATLAGAAQKFNTTITLAFLSLSAERMQAADYQSFDDFIGQSQDLLSPEILTKW